MTRQSWHAYLDPSQSTENTEIPLHNHSSRCIIRRLTAQPTPRCSVLFQGNSHRDKRYPFSKDAFQTRLSGDPLVQATQRVLRVSTQILHSIGDTHKRTSRQRCKRDNGIVVRVTPTFTSNYREFVYARYILQHERILVVRWKTWRKTGCSHDHLDLSA